MSKTLINQYRRDLESRIRYGGSRNESSVRFAFATLLNGYCKSRNFILVDELTIKSRINTSIRPDGIIKDALRLDWGYWESKDEKDTIDAEIEAKFKKGYPTDNILFEDTKTAVLIQNGDESLRIDMENDDDLNKLINLFLDYERAEVKDFRQAINTFSQDLPTILDTLRNLIDSQSPSPLTPNSGNLPPTPNSGDCPPTPNSGDCPPTPNSGDCPPTPNSGGEERGLKVPNVGDLGANLGVVNQKFIEARDKFLKVCQESINPDIKIADIREMIIQHILTEDIFNNIFNEGQFHQENNIARQLQEVIKTFFTGNVKRNTFKTIQSYYNAIIRTASSIVNHQEKQKFLKVVYETFYKAYNPKEADRLGIVYTPNEIVKFMVESTDYLLIDHFTKSLGDKGVEILDPATGTGTFVTEILERLLPRDIEYKYKNEIHCNEVSILPYYIANLNIEYSYQQITKQYLEFNNICLVDTLDHTIFGGKQFDLFAMSQENSERIKRQNDRKISVIIGNPPYNANQQNENDNNKNRSYEAIDKRIKETYIKESTAQKTKVYDMYSRFYRWASDRLNDEGIIAFITNSSFIDARTFDGFRKVVTEEFDFIYIIDLGGDVRKNPKLSGTTHNVFGIQTGVAILFLIKTNKQSKSLCKIYYSCRPEFETNSEKLAFISHTKLENIINESELITPDKNNNWINLADDNDFDSLLPLVNKETKLTKNEDDEEAVFKFFSHGVNTAKDEWLVNLSKQNLYQRITFFINIYNNSQNFDDRIKWSRNLKERHKKGLKEVFDKSRIKPFCYRPFSPNFIYFSEILIDERGYSKQLFEEKLTIAISAKSPNKAFQCLVSDKLIDLHLTGDSQCLPLHRYEKGEKIDNITDWGLEKFREYYNSIEPPLAPPLKGGESEKTEEKASLTKGGWGVESFINEGWGDKIKKIDIFYYVYGVLHNPEYRQKYELNLKREFPRIPFYNDFWQWANWGKQLMDLHLNYETIKPYELTRIDLPINVGENGCSPSPKIKLKADKINGKIIIDEVTTLTEIPPEAWEYKLGNRSALEWILDQYKEKKPKDKTIAEKFNNYKFADYKETVIDLLMRVTTVSIETMKIINEMK